MEASSPSFRETFQILMRLSIARCRASGNLCRVSVCLRFVHDSKPIPSVRVSISDTGVGCCQEEFQDLKDCVKSCAIDVNDWDGELNVTTTCIGDKDIHTYQLCLKETTSSRRTVRLSSKPKNGMNFSGSEMSFTLEIDEENIGDFVAWATNFVRKMLILKVPMIAFELLVDHVKSVGSKHEYVLQSADGVLLPHSMSSAERLASGLQEYVLKHGNTLDKECAYCFTNGEHLKLGNGIASSAAGQTVEVVIAIVDIAQTSCESFSQRCCSKSKVLCFHDFSPCSISQSTFTALKSVDWQSYGLVLKSQVTDGSSFDVLEWENLHPFSYIEIAIHSYSKQYPKLQINVVSPWMLMIALVLVGMEIVKRNLTSE